MSDAASLTRILGLDLGSSSLGWVLLDAHEGRDGRLSPAGLVDGGVRIFDAGTEGDIASGRDASRGVVRREARARRRLLERKVRRKMRLFGLLRSAGLLPPGERNDAAARNELLRQLDIDLAGSFYARHPEFLCAEQCSPQLLPYHLRAVGLRERLEPFELGRALYQLGQRRGFRSNSKSSAKNEREEGEVTASIKKLRSEMGECHLGEHLSRAGAREVRIRGQWTERKMLTGEFDALWEAQAVHHPALTDKRLYKAVYNAIFYQRPLKSAKSLVGMCSLEPEARRAPVASLEAQRFRVLDKANNLEIVTPEGEVLPLAAGQRTALLAALEAKGDLTFDKVKKLLGLTKGHSFNLERGDEKKLVGNRTAAAMRRVLGSAWDALPDTDRSRLVLLVYSTQKHEVLARVCRKNFGFEGQTAEGLAGVRLEEGYASLSRRAMLKLMPLLEQGVRYATARKELYGESAEAMACDSLPPVQEALPGLRNPMVARVLTEMRRVVNALCAVHGKPALIRVELARDLKRSRKDRQGMTKTIRQREKERANALAEVRKAFPESGLRDKPAILKYLLAVECGWRCPYTGQAFNAENLFGPAPTVDVEHILPYSRSLDDSFHNKTLCLIRENREVKGNRTPFEAYGTDAERYEAILDRVRKFVCDNATKRAKLKRFEVPDMAGEFDGFTARQLNDTRYASRLAMEYLGQLYGQEAARRVKATSGGVTALVRDKLGLNHILGFGEKSREDHRHHLVDALAIACTDQTTIQRLAQAAEWAYEHKKRMWEAPFDAPWPTFAEDARRHVLDRAVVSLRPKRKVSGQLHDLTFYSRRGDGRYSVRKGLDKLSAAEVEKIIDPELRDQVRAKLAEAGIKDPSKAFAAGANPIYSRRKRPDGSPTLVRKVRVLASGSPLVVGRDERSRLAPSGNNHHMAVYEAADAKGRSVWVGEVVPLFEAKRRAGLKEPVVRREAPELGKFLFTLSSGDIVAMPTDGGETLWRVRTVYSEGGKGRVEMTPLSDARPSKQIQKAGLYQKPMIHKLGQLGCRKVTVTPLGEIRRDNT